YLDHRVPPVLPSFPTRRSSDLVGARASAIVCGAAALVDAAHDRQLRHRAGLLLLDPVEVLADVRPRVVVPGAEPLEAGVDGELRSEEHTSELQSRGQLVCRLLL